MPLNVINVAISDNNMKVQIAVAGQSANNTSDTFPLSSIMYPYRLTNYLIYIAFIRTKT